MLKKLLLVLLFLLIFISIVYFIEPPKSWNEASTFQILIFFIPLLISLTLLMDLFVKYLPHSFIISLGLILLLALYSIDKFNYITVPATLASIFLAIKLFPRVRLPRFRLTRVSKIPRLTKLNKRR